MKYSKIYWGVLLAGLLCCSFILVYKYYSYIETLGIERYNNRSFLLLYLSGMIFAGIISSAISMLIRVGSSVFREEKEGFFQRDYIVLSLLGWSVFLSALLSSVGDRLGFDPASISLLSWCFIFVVAYIMEPLYFVFKNNQGQLSRRFFDAYFIPVLFLVVFCFVAVMSIFVTHDIQYFLFLMPILFSPYIAAYVSKKNIVYDRLKKLLFLQMTALFYFLLSFWVTRNMDKIASILS